ncbi:MAG: glycosyltransferase [Pseudomonadota bacterium]
MNSPRPVGFVAIGRNEGERFKRCLASLQRAGDRIVYVDSGSRDDSISFARENGAAVVSLDPHEPFTAARARNEGFALLMEQWPDTNYVMFIDGDCELIDGFVAAALAAVENDDGITAVTGRCRERNPDTTIYNRLCDLEWDGPLGDIAACGGIFLVKASGFRAAGGFNPAVIAAEDDDFCIRLRKTGARVHRIDHDMCLHDADMRHFGQWWRRMVRAGHAYAQLGELHPGYFSAERRRAWGWGFILPAAALLGAPFTQGITLALLLLYPMSLVRTRAGLVGNGAAPAHATLGAVFLTLSKFPNLLGMLRYRWKRASGEPVKIVEYK